VQQKDADALAVGAAGGLRRVGGLVHRDAHVPVEAERLEAENVLALMQRQIGLGQNGGRAGDDLLACDALGRLPGTRLVGDVHARLLEHFPIRLNRKVLYFSIRGRIF